jgi:hypothetical protein
MRTTTKLVTIDLDFLDSVSGGMSKGEVFQQLQPQLAELQGCLKKAGGDGWEQQSCHNRFAEGLMNGPVVQGLVNSNTRGLSSEQLCRGTGAGCFAAGTAVQTPRGARPIEALVLGDLVLCHDGREVRSTRVIGAFSASVGELVRIHFSDGTSVEATPWHRFVDSLGGLRYARALTAGVAVRHDGASIVRVIGVETVTAGSHTVFNLALDGGWTFFANGKVVEASSPIVRVAMPSVPSVRP